MNGIGFASAVSMDGFRLPTASRLAVALTVVSILGMWFISCAQEELTIPDATGQEILDGDVLEEAQGWTSDWYEEFRDEYWAMWDVVWRADQFFQSLEQFVETMQRAVKGLDLGIGTRSIQRELSELLKRWMDVAVDGQRTVGQASWKHLVSPAHHDEMLDTITATRDLVGGFGKLLLSDSGCWWEDEPDIPRSCDNFDSGTITASDWYVRAMEGYLTGYGDDVR